MRPGRAIAQGVEQLGYLGLGQVGQRAFLQADWLDAGERARVVDHVELVQLVVDGLEVAQAIVGRLAGNALGDPAGTRRSDQRTVDLIGHRVTHERGCSLENGEAAQAIGQGLDLYPKIFEAEIALRPAMFIDYIEDDTNLKIAAKVSTKEFNDYKDLYKDITEVLGRQLILVAAINNIAHRGSHNSFLPKDGGALSSISKLADKTLSERLKYLDNCWFNLDTGAINAEARNSIAHVKTEYDETSQIIRYFPEKEGLKQEKAKEMYFLEFMRMCLRSFREMHYLHHMIKCLFFYEYLIRNRQDSNSKIKK